MEQNIKNLRRRRDEAAARGDHAEALSLNDMIVRIKEADRARQNNTTPAVERALAVFESALARKRAYGPPKSH